MIGTKNDRDRYTGPSARQGFKSIHTDYATPGPVELKQKHESLSKTLTRDVFVPQGELDCTLNPPAC